MPMLHQFHPAQSSDTFIYPPRRVGYDTRAALVSEWKKDWDSPSRVKWFAYKSACGKWYICWIPVKRFNKIVRHYAALHAKATRR